MSAATKKPSSGSPAGRKSSADPAMSPPSGKLSRTTTTPSSTTNGVARSRSIRGGTPMSARAAMQRPGAGASNLSTSSATSETEDDDARAESAAQVEDLKEQLRRTEDVSEQYQKQTQILQSRIDEASREQGKLEERLHETEQELETLVEDKRDALRQRREMESIYEAERMAITKEREEMENREEEMQAIIQRLKDSLSQRSNTDEDRIYRRSNNGSPNLESGQFAPPSGLARSDSRSNSKLLLQKDKLIESLRMEVAETQFKLVEVESRGGGRLQEVENLLTEARMANARLVEDNESYQLLLQDKTMNGEIGKDHIGYISNTNTDALNALEGRTPTSLADELSQSEDDSHEILLEAYKRLESELKAAKDSNKALTLYINKIIGRLLEHSDFENILDQSSDFKPGASNLDKALPPPPLPKDTSATQSIFQRAATAALSSVTGTSSPSKPSRPRPQSHFPHPTSTNAGQSVTTDPGTAPSIPFGAFGLARTLSIRQSSGRPKSEQFTGGAGAGAGAASVINQMYKGGPVSPPLHGPQTPRSSQSFFAPPPLPAGGKRIPSSNSGVGVAVGSTGTFPGNHGGAGVKSESSSLSEETMSVQGSVQGSPRTGTGSVGSEEERGGVRSREGMASFKGGQVRPLRLVRDREELEREKGKRGSWMGVSMGWAWGGGSGKKEDGGMGEETIRE